MSEQETFNVDPKEKARRRLKYFDNFIELRPKQAEEKQNILISFPDLKYII
jgi:hypothetical protein